MITQARVPFHAFRPSPGATPPRARSPGSPGVAFVLGAALAWAGAGGVAEVAAQAESPSGPAYVQRGERVNGRYRAYGERLDRLQASLGGRLHEDAPELVARLETSPPRPAPPGYGILPRLVADPSPSAPRSRTPSASYSWPATERFIERETEKLDRLEPELARIATLAPGDRVAGYAKMVDAYRQLRDTQRNIDNHIQYNWLWQSAIARDTAGYDHQNALAGAVLEREAVRDALSAGDPDAFHKALTDVTGIEASQPWSTLEAGLRQREATISREIAAETDRFTRPPFVRVAHPIPHLWVVGVPLHTDIADREFIHSFKRLVENVWRLRDGEDRFRVKLAITYLPAARLYRQRSVPRRGEAIDLDAHLARFPRDGGVLTTGAISTHVTAGACIVLGPHDIAPHVLAHEFGHVLGFRDTYIRGYRDRGADGYEVTEIAADPDDIMGSPGAGPVLRRHFERIIGDGSQP